MQKSYDFCHNNCKTGRRLEVVKTWIETHDYGEVDRLQRDIMRDYANDFSKYAPDGEVPKLRWIWDSVPIQIAKENNKFIFSHVKAGKRSADLEDALQWLTDAGLLVNYPSPKGNGLLRA